MGLHKTRNGQTPRVYRVRELLLERGPMSAREIADELGEPMRRISVALAHARESGHGFGSTTPAEAVRTVINERVNEHHANAQRHREAS